MLPKAKVFLKWPGQYQEKDVPCKCGGSTTELGSEKEVDEMF